MAWGGLLCEVASQGNAHGAHPGVTAPIIGARNVGQLKASLDSVKVDMTAEIAEELDAPPSQFRFVPTLTGVPGDEWIAARTDHATEEPAYGIGLVSRLPVEPTHSSRRSTSASSTGLR